MSSHVTRPLSVPPAAPSSSLKWVCSSSEMSCQARLCEAVSKWPSSDTDIMKMILFKADPSVSSDRYTTY